MDTEFEWDPAKAESNFQKHGVSLAEAATAFFDLLSITVPDPLHSVAENRFVITGLSYQQRHLVVVHADRGDRIRIISACLATATERKNMSQELNSERDPDMLDEYDFSNGVRGKYAGRFAQGSNVVVLDPDVAQVFTDSESVNQALRALVGIIQHRSEKTRS
ncbi:MAG: BrnT family toxin [Acidobacteriota bacterium]